ncbi:MAG: carboxymuconolactone decarboxylase family protein [Dehalococcoidia bacterium]|jgi:4-carboxymuconolactone decarboxylase|nr:hypothetical protein [Chloroflexota bacterium]MDP7232350.1 carboxymuconolactone decarboxylase family protein [Dehalococcoidia bacterium]MDP7613203.1 carboxymuconolactone decarboxylase family protein [Dehalococcoidia bacterium]|tara:strand:- start:123 stop:527 length:405 start_codon:yes stop_codon:yes gene_type:complete
MQDYNKLSEISHEWRNWYYDGEPKLPIVAEPVNDAFELINATLFGHIYQRDSLPGKIRSICTIAALVALDKPNQLPGHITGALNYGWEKIQIIEIITQMLFYGGYPASVNALNAAEKTFQEYDKKHPCNKTKTN